MIQITPEEESLLKGFVNSPFQKEVVKKILLNSFLKPREGDIYIKGASRIAIDYLLDGFREMDNYKIKNQTEEEKSNPV